MEENIDLKVCMEFDMCGTNFLSLTICEEFSRRHFAIMVRYPRCVYSTLHPVEGTYESHVALLALEASSRLSLRASVGVFGLFSKKPTLGHSERGGICYVLA